MATKTFEEYFSTKPVLSGPQSTAGDGYLVLRGGTVFQTVQVDNKANAYIDDNSTPQTITAQGAWTQITGFTQGPTTPTFTFANDEFTYAGPSQIVPAEISIGVDIINVEAAVAEWSLAVFVNDARVNNLMSVSTVDNAQRAFFECKVLHLLTVGDVINFRILNRTNASDVIIKEAQAVVSQ